MPRWWPLARRKADPRAEILTAIRTLRDQQLELNRRAGTAFVSMAQVARAVKEQRIALDTAVAQIDIATAAAQRAADSARADGGAAAAAPYEQTVAGLRSQREVVTASGEQLAGLRAGATDNIENAQEMLHRHRLELGLALREQVRLLQRLDELERHRLAAAAIARRQGQPGGG